MKSVRIGDSEGRYVDIDALTKRFPIIDTEHCEVHEGEMYGGLIAVALGSGDKHAVLLKTSSGFQAHLASTHEGSAEGNVTIYEGGSYSNIGIAATPQNRNRNYPNSNVTALSNSCTIVETGTAIDAYHFGAGQVQGGENRGFNEIVLKPSEVYIIILHSEAASNDMFSRLEWYEEPV